MSCSSTKVPATSRIVELEHYTTLNVTTIQPTYYFNTHTAKDKGRISRILKSSKADEGNQIVFHTVDKVSKKFPLSGIDRRMIELKGEESKTLTSVQSAEWLIKRSSNKFEVTPYNFRCENRGLIEDYYEFSETIGKGGFGVVKIIRDKATGEKRAVKIIAKSKCQTIKNLSEEITILQRLVRENSY